MTCWLLLSFCFALALSEEIVPRIVNNPDEVVKKFEPAPAPAPGAGLNVDMWDLQTNNAAELAETALMEDMSKCLQMTYCIVGASTTTEDLKQLHSADQQQRRQVTMASGVLASVVTFKEVLKVTRSDRVSLPQIRRLVASFDLGHITEDKSLCQQAFQCQRPPQEIRLRPVGKAFGMVDEEYCANVKAVCPGVSIGCALCGIFSPGTCSEVCIVGGLFCGTKAIQCKGVMTEA